MSLTLYITVVITLYILKLKGGSVIEQKRKSMLILADAFAKRKRWSSSSKTQEQPCPEQDVEVTEQDTPCKNGQTNRDSHGTHQKPVLSDGVKSND